MSLKYPDSLVDLIAVAALSVSEFLETASCIGRMVPQIMFNLQYQENGGDTMVELWEFPQNSDTANVGVYHTWNRRYLDTSETSYKLRYRW